MKLEVVVPTSLSEITLEQYQSFVRLEGDEEFLAKKAVEIFCGVSFLDLPSVRFKDIYNIVQHIHTMLQEKPSLTPTFEIGGTNYGFIPILEDITYGEFVDLDQFLADPKDLHKAMAVLYRPITGKVSKRYNIEPYEASRDAAEKMKQAPMSAVAGAVVFFLSFRQRITSLYADLFGEGGEESNEYSAESIFAKRWGWYATFYSLAQGDVRRLDEVSRLPVHQCLTFLSFEKSKQQTENTILKKQIK